MGLMRSLAYVMESPQVEEGWGGLDCAIGEYHR